MMSSTQPHADVSILERGNIFFFYRPKKGITHPKNPDDLERVYFMLLPDDQHRHQNRLFDVAHGVFPQIKPGEALPEERDWAFVMDVGHDPKAVLNDLEKDVRARAEPSGQRARPWARPAGEGRYALATHVGHTHLVYYLSKPQHPGEVQEALKVDPEASYIISVKQPYAPSEIELSEKPSYPDELRNLFDGHHWIPLVPTDFLDYKYTQILLIGARKDVGKELGITLDADKENAAAKAVIQMLQEDAKQAKVYGVDLLEPLQEGHWE
ncbi:conserved hypothetical protein [Nitrolancea hollandica Lb]|uniref:Uncharacterized protein n=2 Tax=Nitrolancea hollandica TaxID=1206749 RepID=I4EF93_9BACT|nr:conserved hypothetical protein [Nitrolancea hollandica Lb]